MAARRSNASAQATSAPSSAAARPRPQPAQPSRSAHQVRSTPRVRSTEPTSLPNADLETPASEAPPAFDRVLLTVIDSIAEGVYAVDRGRTITFWSNGAERITGYAAADVVGRRCFANILNHVDEAGTPLCVGRCPLASAMGDGRERTATVYLRHREGHRMGVNVRALPFRGSDDRVVGAIELFSEASSLAVARREAAEFRRLAGTDAVTGLPNRRRSETRIAGRLERRAPAGSSLGLLVLDVDAFKSINDEHGHLMGDEALRVVARTLTQASRADDYVARWGGDEFVILVDGATPESLRSTAERYRALIGRSQIRVRDFEIDLTVSIGVASAHAGDTLASLFERADRALLEAKRGGRNRFVIDGQDRPEQETRRA